MKPAIVKFKPGALYRAVARGTSPHSFAFSPINGTDWIPIEGKELIFMALCEYPVNAASGRIPKSYQIKCLVGEQHGLLEYFSAYNPTEITVEPLKES